MSDTEIIIALAELKKDYMLYVADIILQERANEIKAFTDFVNHYNLEEH